MATKVTPSRMVPPMEKIPMRDIPGCVKVTMAYAILAFCTLYFLAPDGMAASIWPASGLALGALLLYGRGCWPGIVVGQLLGNGLLTGEWGMAFGFGVGNAIAAVVGAHVYQRLQTQPTVSLDTPRDFFILSAAALASASVAASFGQLTLASITDHTPYWSHLVKWWQGDLLGILVITPLMLALRHPQRLSWTPTRLAEAALLFGLGVGIALGSGPATLRELASSEQDALFFVLVVWAALRFGLAGVLLLICVTGLLLLWQLGRLIPGLSASDQQQSLQHIWILLVSLTLVGATLTLRVKSLAHDKRLALGALAAEADANQVLRQAQTLAHIGHWELDIPSGELKWSDEVFRIFEIDQKTFGASYEAFLDAIHPEDRQLVQSAYETSLQHHTSYEVSHRLRMKDGRIKWIVERCETLYDENGSPLRSVGTVQDISQQKHDENAALIANEARLRAIFNTVTDALIITDVDGVIEMVNPQIERIFGYAPAEIIGQNVSVLMPERYAQRHTEQMYAYRYKEESRVIGRGRELAGVHKSGKEFPIELSVNRTQFGDKIMFVGIIRDITERKLAEAALREAKTQAEAANLAKSQFLATMTHELRTPLNSLLGMQQVVLMDAITDRQRECLENGQKAGQHLLEMINNILDYTKIEAGKIELHPTDLDLHDLLRGVVMLMQPHTDGKTLQLCLYIDSNVPRSIRADALRLKQVLINLLQNAIKFTPEGEVNLRVSDIALENGECKLRFAIQDTGIGIARNDQHALFEMFHQVDSSITRRFGGTGLGLAICKQLVLQMGGQIGVESELGQGSTFWFEIPCRALHHAPHGLLTGMAKQQDLRPLHGMRIVLFETDSNQQRAVSRVLLGRGALVAIATTPTELQQHLAQSVCKLVLIGLPTEFPLSDLVGLVQDKMPLILLQPMGTDSHDMPGIRARLAKPVTAETLLRTIDRVLR